MSKTVLITGANRGLGLDLVKLYLQKGWTVFAGSRTASEAVMALQERYKEACHPVLLDIVSDESVAQAVEYVTGHGGKLDVLINNAAVHLEQQKPYLSDTDLSAVLQTFNVNAVGTLRVTQQFLPLLMQGTSAVLANISSEAGSIQNCRRNREFGYCMSKAALNMQTKILRNDLLPKGIQVLAIHPGWMRTDMGGPHAHIGAGEAAEGIVRLIDDRASDFDSPWFIDYTGKSMDV